MEKAQIDRINELARKLKAEGLTPEEMQERDALRKQYIQEFRKSVGLTEEEIAERDALRKQYILEFRESLRGTLDQVYLQQEDGSYKKLEKKKG